MQLGCGQASDSYDVGGCIVTQIIEPAERYTASPRSGVSASEAGYSQDWQDVSRM